MFEIIFLGPEGVQPAKNAKEKMDEFFVQGAISSCSQINLKKLTGQLLPRSSR